MSLYLASQSVATTPAFRAHGVQALGPTEPGEVLITAMNSKSFISKMSLSYLRFPENGAKYPRIPGPGEED